VPQARRKHGLSIAHEDSQGSFIIEPYSDFAARWLTYAFLEAEEEES
jgi:hypothetical protein